VTPRIESVSKSISPYCRKVLGLCQLYFFEARQTNKQSFLSVGERNKENLITYRKTFWGLRLSKCNFLSTEYKKCHELQWIQEVKGFFVLLALFGTLNS